MINVKDNDFLRYHIYCNCLSPKLRPGMDKCLASVFLGRVGESHAKHLPIQYETSGTCQLGVQVSKGVEDLGGLTLLGESNVGLGQ